MKLIVGLGNPGVKYQNTRHNLGKIILSQYIQTQKKGNFNHKQSLVSQILELGQGSNKKIFAIPTEYMNNSGISVQKLAQFFKIDPQNIFVLHDDLDLALGDYKIQFDRGPAGHNGIKSIIENIGTQQFNRIRIGIDKPQNNISIEDYVLQPFSKEELDIIDSIIPKIFEEISKI